MIKNQIKKLLAVTIMIFSLFIFANPNGDTNFFDTSSESEKVLDFADKPEEKNDLEKYIFCILNFFPFIGIPPHKVKLADTLHLYTYHNNTSLFKPPIFL
ncbi:MAG TPA: hypothetical protein EYG74_06210 [Sulfurimonas autotrophica]|nr:hypothetical protein [Sulfurimonas autotrophica]